LVRGGFLHRYVSEHFVNRLIGRADSVQFASQGVAQSAQRKPDFVADFERTGEFVERARSNRTSRSGTRR